ncbi:MAG: hypothetical protein WBB89_17590, partial [Candidatus Acidiferrum sp.]
MKQPTWKGFRQARAELHRGSSGKKRYQCLPELSYFVLRQWACCGRVSSDFTERTEKVTEIEQVELWEGDAGKESYPRRVLEDGGNDGT